MNVEIQRITNDTVLTWPSGNKSLVVLVVTAPGSINVTLPRASASASKFITIRRIDKGRRGVVLPGGTDIIDGERLPIVMENRSDYVTLLSDGNEWVVFAQQR